MILESCASSNYWCRVFSAYGHKVKLINPAYVRPYVKTNKNDAADAEALCEAAARPTMRFVQSKTPEQQDVQLLHRVRKGLVSRRTSLSNQLRGLLGEYGITINEGINNVRKQLPRILEDAENDLSSAGRCVFAQLYDELVEIDKRVESLSKQLTQLSKSHSRC
ncbi:MAG: transposase [Dinoroseobacter sp.]